MTNEIKNMKNLENNSLSLTMNVPAQKHFRPVRPVREELEKTTADYNQCLSLNKVAKLLDMNPQTIRRMLTSGKLQGVKSGRLVRVFQWSLDEYLITNSTVPKDQESGEQKDKPKRSVKSTSHHAAMRRLERLGI